MSYYEKLLEAKNKRFELLEKARSLLEEKKFEEHRAMLDGAELKALNDEIDGYERQLAEAGRFDDGDQRMKGLLDGMQQKKKDDQTQKTLDEVRGTNEYMKAFCRAMREGASVKSGAGREEYNPLYKALTIGGGTPAGSDGGFLVPVEFDNAIIRAAKDYLDLSALFNLEQVTSNTGWRAVEDGTPKAMPKVSEMGTIGKDDQPKFAKVAYAVDTYADRLPISNELLEDNTVGLMNYVAEWFGPKYVLTKNSLLLPILTGLTKTVTLTAGSEDKELRKALVTKLNTAHSRAATLLTNQSGYAEMEGWEDKNGRPLLVPDPTAPEAMRYRGRQVVYGDDTELTAKELYVGNFKALATLFVRKGFEMATTNVGGDAWATNSTECRVLCRMDAKQVFGDAAFKVTFGE